MNRAFFCLLSAVVVGLLGAGARAESETNRLGGFAWARCLARADSPAPRQYAPDREVELRHLALDVTPDFKRRTIEGKATLRFQPLARPLGELKLDAVDLDVRSVTATAELRAWQVTSDKLVLTFAAPIAPGREAKVTVAYRAEPSEGLYFRTPEQGYRPGDAHLFTQGEEIEARHWYPCLDAPNVKFTSEVTCRVPAGMTVISNGRLAGQERDPLTGLVAVHWSQDQPHANYLISLVAGYFKKLEAKYRDVPLAFYTPPSESKEAETSFRDTPDMLAFFEQEIGVSYPWAKYDQVCVNDFVAGGMENTSATTLTDDTLFTEATENLRDSDGLIAHELAHQWFGDLVTCKDWSHIWLNEGFATYYESLYDAHKHGRPAMLYELYQHARLITSIPDDNQAIVRRTYANPSEMFGYLAYPKGAWVLHMLRAQLGKDLYRQCVRTYLERHQYGSVVTEDLRAVIEELSGRSFDQFFDQWVYHAHHPELEANYSWDETARLAKVSLRQVQKLSDNILLFNFPLTLRFKGPSGAIDRTIQVSRQEEDFYFPLDSAPEGVRLDPDYTLLAKLTFNPPNPMLRAQLADKEDTIGRLLAIEQLAGRRDKEAVALLKQALKGDAFYGVRLEASKALRAIHSEDSLAALLDATKQSDARVRQQVIADLGGFYSETACAAARQVLDREKNPDILATAARNLACYARPETRELLLKLLNSKSYRNEVADAAIAAMRLQDDPVYVAPLLETLSQREADFTSHGFAQGLEALAYLARNEEKKDQVREFLLRRLNDQKRTVQLGGLNALGTLGDPKAIAALDTFATAGKGRPGQAAAERAVAALRAARKPVDDFKNLRQEVLDLQKANRDLRQELDDLKKKLDARPPAPPPPKKKPLTQPKSG
ncbi:MAG: M1 family aminopeptidase [Verrucomicrobiota bacterium]|jgi:aminopeptidase N